MIYFVTHYIAISPQDVHSIQTYFPGYYHFQEMESLIPLMFESAARFHPRCKKILLTDMQTRIEVPGVEVIRYPISTESVILSQIESYIAFIKEWDRKGDLIFLDWDMLVQGSLEPIFQNRCDIIFTVREHENMPINTGLIALPKGGSPNTLSLFEHVKEKLRRWPESYVHHWFVDQLAFSEMFQPFIKGGNETDFTYANLKVHLLPCAIYNFSPTPFSTKKEYLEPIILHFKGYRKTAMQDYVKKTT